MLKKDSLYIRLFVWCWRVKNPEKLSICHLFWGTIFFPLAFCTFEKFGFIPSISYYYTILGIAIIVLGGWIMGSIFIFIGIIAAFISIISSIVKYVMNKTDVFDNEEAMKTLNQITSYGSRFTDWILNCWIVDICFEIIICIVDFIKSVPDHIVIGGKSMSLSVERKYKPFVRLGGLFYVMYEYARSVKEKTCKKVILK